MTRKQREVKELKLRVIERQIDYNGINHYLQKVLIEKHSISTLKKLVLGYGLKMNSGEIREAVENYYLTRIKPVNPWIISFDIFEDTESGESILKIYATIRVNIEPPKKAKRRRSSFDQTTQLLRTYPELALKLQG